MSLRIVLVEPREAGNVGAVARVMKNFGFGELWIVGKHPQLLPVAGWWASGADDLLAQAHFAPTLLDAVGDAAVTIATTSSRGRSLQEVLTPTGVAELHGTLGAEQTLALVFGREDSGLMREELMLCQRSAVIPTNDAFPTMNLAQSVGVFCYELATIVPAPKPRELASAALVERLHTRAEALLLEVGFLKGDDPDRVDADLRALLSRADPDLREVTILLGIIRQIEWKIGREQR